MNNGEHTTQSCSQLFLTLRLHSVSHLFTSCRYLIDDKQCSDSISWAVDQTEKRVELCRLYCRALVTLRRSAPRSLTDT